MFVTTKIYLSFFSFTPEKLCNGVGVTDTVLKNLCHTKKFIGDRYAKIVPQAWLNDLVVVRKGTKPIKFKPATVIFFVTMISQTILSTYQRDIVRC